VGHGLVKRVRTLKVDLTLREELLLSEKERILRDLSQKVVKDVTPFAKECAE